MSQILRAETSSETTQLHEPTRELEPLLTGSGVVPLLETGWIAISGADRVRWLNGMVTNSVQDLAPGAGCYTFFLNAQGRIQGDGTIFAQPDQLLIETGLAQVGVLIPILDRFIIMDDVELTDLSERRRGLLVAGPHAPELLKALHLLPPEETEAPGFVSLQWRSQQLQIIRAYSPLIPRYEIWCETEADPASADDPLAELIAELLARGAASCSPSAADRLRIAEGTPLFGVDIRDRDLPQETGVTRALHFAKGCYLGQEIVERIRSRGNVHRTLAGFLLTGGKATIPAALTADGKSIGELTSVAELPTVSGTPVQVGLGLVRRETLALRTPLEYEGGTARPVALPFKGADTL